jgi:hypothetical protein
VTPVTHARPSIQATVRLFGPENDRVDHDFGLLARVGLVVDTERVRGLVDNDPQLRVRRRVGVDDDPLVGPIDQPPVPAGVVSNATE